MARTPRKEPRQGRSKTLVDAILIATARILPSRGVARATTNQIADLAGVSVGSLYQYFPDKDSIFARLIERELARNEEVAIERAEALRGAPLADVVHAVVDTVVDRLLDHGPLLRELMMHAHHLDKVQAVIASRDRVQRELARIFEDHPEVARGRDLLRAAEICVSALMGVLQEVVLETREQQEREAIKTELTQMFVAYLRSPPG
ncbi:MAG TPA: TetR/AcrR family transcriptional regulator [Polyangiaceae bacterium]